MKDMDKIHRRRSALSSDACDQATPSRSWTFFKLPSINFKRGSRQVRINVNSGRVQRNIFANFAVVNDAMLHGTSDDEDDNGLDGD